MQVPETFEYERASGAEQQPDAGRSRQPSRASAHCDLQKPPGIAEVINWTLALELLGAGKLDAPMAGATIGSVLKYREDGELARDRVVGQG